MKTDTQLATEAIGFPPAQPTEADNRKLRLTVLRRDFRRIKQTTSLTGLNALLDRELSGNRQSILIINQLKTKIQVAEFAKRKGITFDQAKSQALKG